MDIQSLLDTLIAKPDVANAIAAIGSVALALVATFISLISLYVANSTLKHQRLHNKLSVRPLAYISVGDYEDCIFVKLQNNGSGPLILKSMQVLGAVHPEKPLIDSMPVLTKGSNWATFTGSLEGRSLQPGADLILLELNQQACESISTFELSRDAIRTALGALQIQVVYSDIYESKLPAFIRDLKWFHRNLHNSTSELKPN